MQGGGKEKRKKGEKKTQVETEKEQRWEDVN